MCTPPEGHSPAVQTSKHIINPTAGHFFITQIITITQQTLMRLQPPRIDAFELYCKITVSLLGTLVH